MEDLKNLAQKYNLQYVENPTSFDGLDEELIYVRKLWAPSTYVFSSFKSTSILIGTIAGQKIEAVDLMSLATSRLPMPGTKNTSTIFSTRITIGSTVRYARMDYTRNSDSIYGGVGCAPADFLEKVFSEVAESGTSPSISSEGCFEMSKALFVTMSYLCISEKRETDFSVKQNISNNAKNFFTPAVFKVVGVFVLILILGLIYILYQASMLPSR